MALKTEAIEAIAKLTKIKAEDLKAAIENKDEVDLAVDEKLTVLNDTELQTVKSNSYEEGKVAGVDISIKDIRKELNLDFQGKTIKGLVEAAQKKAVEEAKIPETEKVKELQTKVTTLQKTVEDQDAKILEKDKEVSNVKLNSELFKNIPAGAALENDEVIELMKLKGYGFESKDGKVIVTKDGQPLVDKVTNPVPAKDVISGFLKEKKLIADEGEGEGGGGPEGRGGGGKAPVKFTKLSEVKAKFKAEGKSELGSEFSEAVQKAVADNKDFDMNS